MNFYHAALSGLTQNSYFLLEQKKKSTIIQIFGHNGAATVHAQRGTVEDYISDC